MNTSSVVRVKPRQQAVLDAIATLLAKGYSPTWREVGEAVGLSAGHVFQVGRQLASLGLIVWEDGQARTLRLTARAREARNAR